MKSKSNKPSKALHRFFSGIAESIFQSQLGVVDPPMIDYVSNLLIRFVRVDAVYRVRHPDGKRLQGVGDMLLEAEERLGDARREVHRHIGDYTLFWAGLFPESLAPRRGPVEMDQFADYCCHGKRAYLIASSIESSQEEDAPADLLQRLSHQFEMCAYGLREVRREWERRDESGPMPPLLVD